VKACGVVKGGSAAAPFHPADARQQTAAEAANLVIRRRTSIGSSPVFFSDREDNIEPSRSPRQL
jgi:hypothetical protein